jgi:hypothetical protein
MKRGKRKGTGRTADQEWRATLLGQIEACFDPDGHVNDPKILASLLRIAREDGLDPEALFLEAQKSLGLQKLDLRAQYKQLVRDEAVQEPS